MRELLLVTIEDQQYGIWKDDILSVKDLQTLHRLPLSPACVAGISIVDDHTVTLADLPVCIGYAPAAGNGKGRILMLSGADKIIGFMLSGEIDYFSVPGDAVFPMPEYLKTEVIDSCAVRDAVPIPVINIFSLSSQLLKSEHELPRAAFAVPHAESPEKSSISSVRVFELGGELFAAPSKGMEGQPAKPRQLAQLSLVPQYVKGVTFHNGTIMPVIDLSQRIKRQKSKTGDCMIIGDISSETFGFLVDEDCGTWPARDIVISDLPPIAQSRAMRAAVLKAGQIMPLADLAALLSAEGKSSGEKPFDQRYVPDPQFNSLFKRQDVDVVEFLLLGARHALPECEVEDVIPFKAYREVPDTLEIVVGVAAHKGMLLPVLDLAMVFGRRSLSTLEWRMMLVKNGDFRALVVTEAVFGKRRLALDIQRAVPILLPHQVVYGCYPAAEAVRLILNVEAIAVHFEKSLVKELLPALSQEMKQAAAEIVPELLDEEAGAALKSEKDVKPAESWSAPAAAAAEPAMAGAAKASINESAASKAPLETSEEQERKQEGIVHQAGEPITPAAAPAPEPEEKGASAVPRPDSDESYAPSGPDIGAATEPAAPGEGTTVSQDEAGEEAVEAGGKKPEQAVSAAAGNGQEAGVEEKPAEEKETEAGFVDQAVEQESVSSIERQLEPEPVAQSETQPQPEPESEHEPEPALSETMTTAACGMQRFEEEKMPEAVPAPAIDFEKERRTQKETGRPAQQHTFPYQDASSERSEKQPWKRRVAYGAVAALLAALLYLMASSNKPELEKPVKEALPAKVESVHPKAEPKAPAPVENIEPPLVLDVPASKPTDIDIYVVVKGDTLWSISERFTGNPFNYPRIAGENRIANPDLIFPGQKIRLVKK